MIGGRPVLVQVQLFSTWVKIQVTGKKATQVEVKVLQKICIWSTNMYKVKKCTWSTDQSTLSISNRSIYRCVSTRWCYVRELRSSCIRWLRLPASCQHQWLIRTGHRYLRNDANHSMWPALIGQEIYDSVDLTPGDMFHHIVVYWGRCLQFP